MFKTLIFRDKKGNIYDSICFGKKHAIDTLCLKLYTIDVGKRKIMSKDVVREVAKMIKIYKGVATLVTAAVMLGSPMVSGAASNIDSNEQSVLEWIAANTDGGKNSTAYKIAKGQLEYTRFGSFPTIAFASDSNEVIDTESELRSAIDAASDGATIVIGGDIDLTAPLNVTKNITLTATTAVTITDKNKTGDLFTASKGATLTLGENITGESAISVLYANGGKIVVDGATLTCTHPQYCLGAASKDSTIEVKAGTLTAAASALDTNGGNIVVSGGTITSTGADANGDGYVTIFVSEGPGGTITITGGTVESAYGAAVDANKGTVTISGGEFIGGEGDSAVAAMEGGSVAITGGTFSSDVDEYLDSDNYVTVTDEDTGNTVVITKIDTEEELKAAIDAAEAGDTIIISGDIDLTTPLNVTKDITLTATTAVTITDNNAKNQPNGDLFTASKGATLTLGENITGESAISVLYANGGTITITGGTVSSAYGAAVDANKGSVTISGGEILGGEGVSAVAAMEGGSVAITGGTFSSEIDEDYLVDGYGDVENSDGKFTVHKHTVVDVAAVDATCTEAGSTAGTKCSECEKILSGCEVIPAAGHKSVAVAAVDATCTEAGSTAGTKCSECEKILSGCKKIKATGHTLTAVPAKEATTAAEGNKAYWTCECGKWFADKDAKTEITDKTSVVIPKLDASEETVEDVAVVYSTHVQSKGWIAEVSDGKSSGTVGEAKRLESIKIEVKTDADLGISYSTHVQSKGWIDPVADGKESGTTGQSKRLEAIKIELTGADKDKYNVWYRVHAQSYGWLGWAKNGEAAGTAGQSKRLEAIEIVVLPVGETPEGTIGYSYIELGKTAVNAANAGFVNYKTHVQTYGDQSYVSDGSIAGTFGEAKRLEAISINLNTELLGVDGGIKYKTHVQKDGWLDYVENGKVSGTVGEAKRLEAICIELTGDVAKEYDVYYRVHAQTYGWLGWAKNGEEAGTAGLSKRLEAIQIVLVPKGQDAPSILPGAEGTKAFIEK